MYQMSSVYNLSLYNMTIIFEVTVVSADRKVLKIKVVALFVARRG